MKLGGLTILAGLISIPLIWGILKFLSRHIIFLLWYILGKLVNLYNSTFVTRGSLPKSKDKGDEEK